MTPAQVDNLFERLDRIESNQHQLKLAVIGDEQYGHPGLIKRTKDLEEKSENNSKHVRGLRIELRTITAVALGAGVILSFFKERIFGE